MFWHVCFQFGGVILEVNITDLSTIISFSDYYEGAAPALLLNHTPWATINYRQRSVQTWHAHTHTHTLLVSRPVCCGTSCPLRTRHQKHSIFWGVLTSTTAHFYLLLQKHRRLFIVQQKQCSFHSLCFICQSWFLTTRYCSIQETSIKTFFTKWKKHVWSSPNKKSYCLCHWWHLLTVIPRKKYRFWNCAMSNFSVVQRFAGGTPAEPKWGSAVCMGQSRWCQDAQLELYGTFWGAGSNEGEIITDSTKNVTRDHCHTQRYDEQTSSY